MATLVEVYDKIFCIVEDLMPDKENDKYLQELFYNYEYDSDTHWIKIGIPSEWCDNEKEGES
jgi:hypothetical protein